MSDILIAQNRFGLGARPDNLASGDAKFWLRNQLSAYRPFPQMLSALPSRQELAVGVAKSNEGTFFDNIPNLTSKIQTTNSSKNTTPKKSPIDLDLQINAVADQYYEDALTARAQLAITSATPFIERLVHFWANHFAVSANSPNVRPYAGAFEFEAIRPHVLGNFSDMLLAVEQHPAMLIYSDQVNSVGEHSPLGEKTTLEKNLKNKLVTSENLAREILQHHTLGERTYTQEDILEFAKVLTGWTITDNQNSKAAQNSGREGQPGTFIFSPLMHEPGIRYIVGKKYSQTGIDQAQAVLKDIAIHPATAKHISTKLVRHFISDNPSPALIEKLSQTFLSSSGNLTEVYKVLINAPESWQTQAAKFKTPWEWLISSMRALNTKGVQSQSINSLCAQLGQPIWKVNSPAGYDDASANWTTPDVLMHRVEVAELLASRSGQTIDPKVLASQLLGNQLSNNTIQTLAQADSLGQALALMLVSPEFLRR
ncbi:MAG: DUF1800 domain-containing protein [Pseudomonadota bacterium]